MPEIWSVTITTSPVSLPSSQLALPGLLNSSLSTVLQSRPVELPRTGLSDTRLLYCGTLCQLNFAILKTIARRGQISYAKSTFLSKLKTYLFHKSYPGSSKSASLQDYKTLTNNDLDSSGFLFRLPFLLYCMTLRYLYVRRLIKGLSDNV